MSLATLLRRVDPQASHRAARVRSWVEQGHPVHLEVPPRGETYLSFRADHDHGHWRGWVDARCWLAWALPGLEGMLTQGCSDQDIAHLFELAARPLALPAIEGLGYGSISDIQVVGAQVAFDHPLPTVQTPGGRLWLTRLPVYSPRSVNPLVTWVSTLPMPMSWVIGHTLLSAHGMARLAERDVLRIVGRDWQIRLSGRCIGRFDLQKEGLIMRCTREDTAAVLDDPSGASTHEAESVDALPVRLEFVLHEQVCTLAQLAGWMEGQVMSLAQDSVRGVQVRANGQVVAQGELVRWDDRLGVELHTLYRGKA